MAVRIAFGWELTSYESGRRGTPPLCGIDCSQENGSTMPHTNTSCNYG